MRLLKNRVHSGFTLAEILITLGIIGVVATLTLPNVMSNYAKRTQVAQLQRTVNAVASAASSYLLDHRADTLEDAGLDNDIETFLVDYLGCTRAIKPSDAFTASYKDLDGSSSNDFSKQFETTNNVCGKLPTGATVCIIAQGENATGPNQKYHIAVDINGNSGPNTHGRDAFDFGLSPKGRIVPHCMGHEDNATEYCSTSNPYAPTSTCFTRLMEAGWEMDY